jgi:V/A-type H+-transporting ATPase subunit E
MSGGIDKIIAEIEKSAGDEAGAILAEARARADMILADARQEAARQERIIAAKGQQEAGQEAQRIVAEARIRARRAEIDAREELMQQAFTRAQKILEDIAGGGAVSGTDYKATLERLICFSVVSSGAGDLEVFINRRDRGVLSPADLNQIAARIRAEHGTEVVLTLSPEPLACRGGVVVKSTDGSVRVDNTFEARLERLWQTIRTEVARLLFEEEASIG